MSQEKQILEKLTALKIHHRVIHHRPVWHMEDGPEFADTTIVKNMLLYDTSAQMFYLDILLSEERVDFKKIAHSLNITRKNLRFASDDELKNELGIISGMVSPLIINENTKNIELIISPKLQGLDNLGFHAGTNTETVVIAYQDLLKFEDCLHIKYVTI